MGKFGGRMKVWMYVVLWMFPLLGYANTQQVELDKLIAAPTLTLKCTGDEQGLDIPLAHRWNVKKVTLNLHYVSSINLITSQSQLVVKLNGMPIAQTKLDALSPDVLVQLNLPVQYLSAGYNKLSFAVAQHSESKGCEKGCSPDMWTTIDLKRSVLAIDYENKAVPVALSSVGTLLFDPKVFPQAEVHLVTDTQDGELLNPLSIVASGVAHHFDYRQVSFTVSRQLKPGVDNILVGKHAFVQGLLGESKLALTDHEQGGYVSMLPLPQAGGGQDVGHALVVVTGKQVDDVKLAAETFASMSTFPGTPSLSAYEFKLPKLREYSGRELIEPGKEYTLKALNFPTATFQGGNASGKDINFRLPPDFMIRPNLSAKLALHFAYGAGMRETSAMNIVVNGKIVKGIHLGNTDGASFQNYVIEIPTRLFQPGSNRISFATELHPPLKECDLMLTGNMFLTVFDDTTFSFPDMPHFVELPNLELFMLSGFPFTRWADGYESKVVLTQTDDNTLSAAMNLIGLMTQKSGFPLYAIQLDKALANPWKGDFIMLGSPDSISAALGGKSLPFTKGKSAVPYALVRDWASDPVLISSVQSSQLGEGQGYLMQFESPYESGRTGMVFAARDSKNLLSLSEALLKSEVQAQTEGELTMLDLASQEDKAIVKSFKPETTYTTGKSGKKSFWQSYLYTHPYIYYGLVILLTIGFAITLFVVLRRYRKKRVAGRPV